MKYYFLLLLYCRYNPVWVFASFIVNVSGVGSLLTRLATILEE
jgi:hypothetical protein